MESKYSIVSVKKIVYTGNINKTEEGNNNEKENCSK